MALHKALPYGQIHIIHAFEYANASARTGAAGLTANDVGKAARQTDNDTWWLLTDHSPVTWIPIGGGISGSSIDELGDVDTTTIIPTSGQHLEWDGSNWVPGDDADAINDHGGLTGLGDDDHTQYLTETRHDALPFDNPHNVTAAQVGAASGVHTHTESDITDLNHYDSTNFSTDFSSANLNNLATKNHNNLNNIGTDDHHAKLHAHNGADGSGTVAHSDTTGQTANDHHNELHTITSHSDTTATGTELNELTDGSTTTLHTHTGIGDVDEDNIIYVGKHGNDTNNGLSIEAAVFTFGKAVQLAETENPSSSNIWGIVCLDGGIYTENITLTDSYIHVFAANATLQGSISIPTETSIEFESVDCSSGTALTVGTGSGTAYAQIKKLETDGCNGIVNTSSGILNTEIEFYKQTGGIGVTASSITHLDIQDWDIYGVSPTAIKNTGGMINARCANMADRGGSGTSLGFDCNSSTTNALVVYANLDTLFDVESGAILNLVGANVGGTQFNDGTVNLTTAGSPATHTHTESDIIDLDHYESSDFSTDHAALTGTCPQNPKAHTVASHSDTTATGAELNELTDGSETTLHGHAGGAGDVSANANIADNKIVRGDGGVKDVQESLWSIDDNGCLTAGFSKTGYILDCHNTNTSGGNGFRIKAGEALGDIAMHIADTDDTFQILELEADQGYLTLGKTYAQTLTDNSVVYGVDIQHTGNAKDFNTQSGTYRKAGVDIVMPSGGSTGQVLEKINGTDYNTQWATPSGGGSNQVFHFYADQLESPINSNWAINALAPAVADPSNAALTVRKFDDSSETGVGFTLFVPSGKTNIVLRPTGRAQTAPGSTKGVALHLYNRGIPNNAAIESWSSASEVDVVQIPTNAYFQYDTITISLSSLSIETGKLYQFQLTRDYDDGYDSLSGNYLMIELQVEFT